MYISTFSFLSFLENTLVSKSILPMVIVWTVMARKIVYIKLEYVTADLSTVVRNKRMSFDKN